MTDTGEEVVLRDDGTWAYASTAGADRSEEIEVNDESFEKMDSATFLVSSKANDSGFWIDAGKWSFSKGRANSDAEYEFQLKGEELYGMAITERVRISPEQLAKIGLTHMRSVAPDARVVEKEYRRVNGNRVIYMQMRGTVQSMDLTYRGYYYSDASGSSQLLTYTGSNLASEYESESDAFLNGLVTTQ